MTDAIVYYSNTGKCRLIADWFAARLGYPAFELTEVRAYRYRRLLLIFPVHCQHIPDLVKAFLERVEVRYLTAIAVYGRMAHGNVLFELQKHYSHTLIAGAYLPTGHSYLSDDGDFSAFDRLEPIIAKQDAPGAVTIPRSFCNPLSKLWKGLRSRLGVKLWADEKCDRCGVCTALCPMSAIMDGKPNRRCIRCLRCVGHCPRGALRYHCRLPMRLYLKKKKVNRLTVYV